MLATLVRFSIRFYGIVIALAVLILLYGSYRFATAGLAAGPEARVAAGVVNYALGGGGGSAVSGRLTPT